MSTTVHPSREQLAAFLAGRLGKAEAAELETHLESCEACGHAIESLPPDGLVWLLRLASDAAASTDGTVSDTDQAPARGAAGASRPRSAHGRPELPLGLAEHPRYRVIDLVGVGGMGAVYRAEHRLMERPVALKVISPDLVARPGAVERFRREVKAAARLLHPNIVAAHDAEQAGDVHFLVMEFVEGTSLARLVERGGPLGVAEACEYIRQAAAGLQHAFEHGMVHRDIKPQNLMVAGKQKAEVREQRSEAADSRDAGDAPAGSATAAAVVKILDFGLARFVSETEPAGAVTDAGAVVGTADYIAPEQARDTHTADIRADIYSLGCTFYHLLAGHPPFPKGTFVQKLVCHLERTPPPIRTIRPDVPSELAEIIERMMAKEPAARFQTPAHVVDAIAAWTRRGAASGPIRTTTSQLPATAGGPLAPARRNPFGTGDVPDPDGEDVQVFAAGVELRGDPADANAPLWCPALPGVLPQAIDGTWYSRWNGGTAGDTWSAGTATVRSVGERVYIHFADSSGPYLIDAQRHGDRRLVGRYTHCEDPANSSPWVGVIVDSGRIDGQWTHGRWDLRRHFMDKPASQLLAGHTARVACVAFSPDGRTLASASFDHSARVWDTVTGESRHVLRGHPDHVLGVAFSRDGKLLATSGGDGSVRLWDAATGQMSLELRGHSGAVFSVAFGGDGRTLASAGADRAVRLWELPSAREVARLDGHTEAVLCVRFSRDGRTLASGSEDHTARLWDAAGGHVVHTLGGHSERVTTVAFSADGRTLATAGYDKTIRLWDVATGQLTRAVAGAAGAIFSVAIHPNGRTLALGTHTLLLCDLATGEMNHSLRGHKSPVLSVAFSPDGRVLASASVDYTLRLWHGGW